MGVGRGKLFFWNWPRTRSGKGQFANSMRGAGTFFPLTVISAVRRKSSHSFADKFTGNDSGRKFFLKGSAEKGTEGAFPEPDLEDPSSPDLDGL